MCACVCVCVCVCVRDYVCMCIHMVKFEFCNSFPGASGIVTFTDLPPGDYKFRVIARDIINNDRAVIRTGLWIRGNDDFCTVYTINRRVTVVGNSATVEFGNTGAPTSFRCRLDNQPYFTCKFNCYTANSTVPRSFSPRLSCSC